MSLIQRLAASCAASALLATGACASMPVADSAAAPSVAPGAPGVAPTWASAEKTAAGSSYEAYVDGQYRDGGPTGAVSKVWFSVANGILTETMYGLIHEAQIKQMRFALAIDGGVAVEGADLSLIHI